MQETWVQSLGREDPLEEGMAVHSSILAWKIPWTEEPGGLQSIGSQRVGHNWSNLARTHRCSFHSQNQLQFLRLRSLGHYHSSLRGTSKNRFKTPHHECWNVPKSYFSLSLPPTLLFSWDWLNKELRRKSRVERDWICGRQRVQKRQIGEVFLKKDFILYCLPLNNCFFLKNSCLCLLFSPNFLLWKIHFFPYSSVCKESACNAGDPGLILGLGRSTGKGIGYPLQYFGASLVVQTVKNLPAMWKTWVWSLGWEDPGDGCPGLEKGKATHSSILDWRIPWTISPWGRKESDTTARASLTFFTSSADNPPKKKNFTLTEKLKNMYNDVKRATHKSKMDFIRIKSFCSWRTLLRKRQDKPQIKRKYFKNTYLIKDLCIEYREIHTTNSLIKIGKIFEQIFYQRRDTNGREACEKMLNIVSHCCCCCCYLATKSCPTLCNPMNCSPPGSSVHAISQARILEWIAISFSRGSSWPRDQTHVSCLAGGFFTTEPPGKPS